jgi:hypothetical protein
MNWIGKTHQKVHQNLFPTEKSEWLYFNNTYVPIIYAIRNKWKSWLVKCAGDSKIPKISNDTFFGRTQKTIGNMSMEEPNYRTYAPCTNIEGVKTNALGFQSHILIFLNQIFLIICMRSSLTTFNKIQGQLRSKYKTLY